jgi:hypothetical protein
MLVRSFNLSQSFNYATYLFREKRFKSEINCFCIRTMSAQPSFEPVIYIAAGICDNILSICALDFAKTRL